MVNNVSSEQLLADIAQSLKAFDGSISALKEQISSLQEGQVRLQSEITKLQPQTEEWQWLEDCYYHFHVSPEAARQALRAGKYKSGTEYQKVSRRYKLNVRAIQIRLTKKQSRRVA